MINFTSRSDKKELLDDDNIPFQDIRQNMRELNTINTLLGGHQITIEGVRQLKRYHTSTTKELSICEIGCGGGDNLQAISAWCNKQKLNASFTGIDIKASCLDFARQQYPQLPATWIEQNYARVNFSADKPSIIFSSLFCHHFSNDELVRMIAWMKDNSRVGFFINDLHRHPLAYYSIQWITRLFSRSYLVKNDAPLSVARGFKKSEWKLILSAAGITNYRIKWKWAFRFLIVCHNGK